MNYDGCFLQKTLLFYQAKFCLLNNHDYGIYVYRIYDFKLSSKMVLSIVILCMYFYFNEKRDKKGKCSGTYVVSIILSLKHNSIIVRQKHGLSQVCQVFLCVKCFFPTTVLFPLFARNKLVLPLGPFPYHKVLGFN